MWRECVTVAFVGAIAASVNAPEKATRVAVVDLREVLTTAKPFQAGDQAIRAWIGEQKAALKKRQEQLRAKKGELEAFSSGSPERSRLELEVAKLSLDLDFEVAAADTARETRVVEHQRKSFETATEAVRSFAKEHGIDLVVQLRKGPLTASNQTELSSEIFLRDVVAADAALDITADVIKLLER